MSRNVGRLILVLASCGVLFAGSAFGQQNESCNLRDLKGAYGFTIVGKNLDLGVGYILSGLFRSDGNGNFTGSGKQTVGVQATGAKFTGTYQVNSDCTGTAHLRFVDGLQSDLFFILVQDGEEAIILDVGTGVLESGDAKRVQAARHKL